jgi:hypothetical protein
MRFPVEAVPHVKIFWQPRKTVATLQAPANYFASKRHNITAVVSPHRRFPECAMTHDSSPSSSE